MLLKNSHFRQILLEPLFDNFIDKRTTCDLALSPLVLAQSTSNAFHISTGPSDPNLLKNFDLVSFNYSSLAVISPYSIMCNLQIEFGTTMPKIFTRSCLKKYSLLSKLMIKISFVKYQLNRKQRKFNLEFFRMRHIISCFEAYTTSIISTYHNTLLEDLEHARIFSQVVDSHEQFIKNILNAFGGHKVVFDLLDRLLRIISRCCENNSTSTVNNSSSHSPVSFKEFENLSRLFVQMIRKLAEDHKSSIMQHLLVQVNFNRFYDDQSTT